MEENENRSVLRELTPYIANPETLNAISDPPGGEPEVLNNLSFMPAFLRRNIGKWMKVEALIGNSVSEKVGQLLRVGANYLVLKQNTNPVTTAVCDIYCVKFVTILYDPNPELLH